LYTTASFPFCNDIALSSAMNTWYGVWELVMLECSLLPARRPLMFLKTSIAFAW
jgi:hypothetical protein